MQRSGQFVSFSCLLNTKQHRATNWWDPSKLQSRALLFECTIYCIDSDEYHIPSQSSLQGGSCTIPDASSSSKILLASRNFFFLSFRACFLRGIGTGGFRRDSLGVRPPPDTVIKAILWDFLLYFFLPNCHKWTSLFATASRLKGRLKIRQAAVIS